MGQWTFLDLLFVVIILASVVLALTKGLVREIVSLVALVGGFALAVLYYRAPAAAFAEFSRTESIANLLGFMTIFVGCLLAGAVVSFAVNRILKAASIRWVDRLLGGVFGLLRGWAICSIMVVALIAFPINETFMARSQLAPYMLAGARTAVLIVPQGLKDTFDGQYRKVVQAWNQSRSVP